MRSAHAFWRELRGSSATPLWLVFVGIVSVLVFAQHLITPGEGLVELSDSIPEDRKLLITMYAARSETMATWAMGLVAAMAFMLNYFKDRRPTENPLVLQSALASFLVAFISIFLSQVLFDKISGMLMARFDPFSSLSVQYVASAQYFFLILSVVFFVGFALFLSVRNDDRRVD